MKCKLTKWTTLFLALALILILFSIPILATDDLTTQIERADQLYKAGDKTSLVEAEIILIELLKKYPDNYELLWKTARIYEKLAKLTKDPLATYEQAKVYADKAASLYPNRVEGHYWVASLIGRIGEEKGILNSLFNVKPMKEKLDLCVQLDPTFPDAYYVLGLLHWKVPGRPISIGDKKKAIEYAAKAVELEPESFLFQWGLYQAYDAAGRNKEAKEVLQHILQMPVAPGFEYDAIEYQDLAKKALK